MIPKKIHYIWFGPNPKSNLILKCIETWKKVLPEYEINEWNDQNISEFMSSNYFKVTYENKKWAFASDFARMKILEKHGGIYLDTDMFVLKNFDNFLDNDLVLGREDLIHISAGMIACKKNNIFIKKVLDRYENLKPGNYIAVPKILTEIYENEKDILESVEIKLRILESKYLYPFSQENINKFNFKNAPEESYAVHMWDYSWGTGFGKFTHKHFKKYKTYGNLIKIFEKVGIKNVIKKILKFV
jgi:mannosyltransferase OCH1-like enzyme